MEDSKDFPKVAVDNFKQGYNCAQAVLLTFADEAGLNQELALKLASSFGGGMGRLREVCGAVSAMFMIAGILKGYTSNTDDFAKSEHYSLIQKLAEEFKQTHSTIICRELLNLSEKQSSPIPSERNEEYYSVRPCEHYIKTAAELITRHLIS